MLAGSKNPLSLDRGVSNNIVYTGYNEKNKRDVYIVALREEEKLIGYYEKHEFRGCETMKPYYLW